MLFNTERQATQAARAMKQRNPEQHFITAFDNRTGKYSVQALAERIKTREGAERATQARDRVKSEFSQFRIVD